jgi:hypothetical protein
MFDNNRPVGKAALVTGAGGEIGAVTVMLTNGEDGGL